jgi:hypothetical protein
MMISFLGLQNLINEFYDINDIDEINKKIIELELDLNLDYNNIYLFVYEKIKENEKINENEKKYEIIKDKKKIILITEIFFHYQTLKNLEKRNIINFLDNELKISHNKFNKFVEWTDKNLTILEKKRLILLTGSCFFTTGIRNSYKIDGLFINTLDKNIRETELQNLIYNDLFNNKDYMIGMNFTKSWKKIWDIYNMNFYNMSTSTFNDFTLCMDYNMYYYYKGLKIITLDTSIFFKLSRYNEYDFIDLLSIYRIYPGITDIELFFDTSKINNKKKLKKALSKYISYDKRKIKIQDIF